MAAGVRKMVRGRPVLRPVLWTGKTAISRMRSIWSHSSRQTSEGRQPGLGGYPLDPALSLTPLADGDRQADRVDDDLSGQRLVRLPLAGPALHEGEQVVEVVGGEGADGPVAGELQPVREHFDLPTLAVAIGPQLHGFRNRFRALGIRPLVVGEAIQELGPRGSVILREVDLLALVPAVPEFARLVVSRFSFPAHVAPPCVMIAHGASC